MNSVLLPFSFGRDSTDSATECGIANGCDPYPKNGYGCGADAGANGVLLPFSLGRDGADGVVGSAGTDSDIAGLL